MLWIQSPIAHKKRGALQKSLFTVNNLSHINSSAYSINIYCVLLGWFEMSSIGSGIWILSPQMVALFEEATEFLGWKPCQRKFIPGGRLWVFILATSSLLSLLGALDKDVNSQLPNPAECCHACPTIMKRPSGTVIQSKLFHKPLMVVVLHPSNRRVTNTALSMTWHCHHQHH